MTTDALTAYTRLVQEFSATDTISSGQMFGKACLKVNGKAFIAQHKETVVFKLSGDAHVKAMSLDQAQLWDPSGKGRPMKEWVALQAEHHKKYATMAHAALDYVKSQA